MSIVRMVTFVAALMAAMGAHAAEEWGIEHEETTRFEAKVVDILCELSGDCPANCGNGKRQLGLLKDDGTLILAAKNFDPFAGTVNDLIGFCNQRIIADGLLIKDPAMPLFALQFKRLAPDGPWSRANWFVRDWAEREGVAANSTQAQSWFRNDPLVRDVIAKDGVYGLPGVTPKP